MSRPESRKWTQRRQRVVDAILPILKQTYPGTKCSLDYSNPLQLLVATILSAQCTDERVNAVTKTLFKKYRATKDYAAAPQEQLEKDIQSTGFYRNKAKAIRGMAQALLERHEGTVPDTMEHLTALSGVGRKTANVVLGNAFEKNVGVVVDTHVTRVANRLRLTDHLVDAVKIEQDLVRIVPQDDWTIFSHLLIHHGRAICQARKPRCEVCPLLSHCPAGQKFMKAEDRSNNQSASGASRGPGG